MPSAEWQRVDRRRPTLAVNRDLEPLLVVADPRRKHAHGDILAEPGREALPLHRKAYEIYKVVLEDDYYHGVFPLLSIAYFELKRGYPGEAEAAADIARQRFRATVPGSFHEGVATCLVGIAKERQDAVAEGAAMVAASHELLDPANLEGSPYLELCRYPGFVASKDGL